MLAIRPASNYVPTMTFDVASVWPALLASLACLIAVSLATRPPDATHLAVFTEE
jgi:hypothetical protein